MEDDGEFIYRQGGPVQYANAVAVVLALVALVVFGRSQLDSQPVESKDQLACNAVAQK